MFKTTFAQLGWALFSISVVAQGSPPMSSNVGYTGTLSSLDGGLGGTVTVKDANTLEISSYTLKDASAPALYWWGTTNGVIKDGFRISNEQVTEAATTDMLEIKLDAGKTSSDFTTVGLWCERLSANFGQAELKASDGTSTSSNPPSSASGAAATSSMASGAAPVMKAYGAAFGVMVSATMFVAWMI